jgi:hypothetical protein
VRTGFQAHLQWTTQTPPYWETTVGKMRRWMAAADDTVYTADPAKLARAIFDTTRSSRPPLRLTLGADAYGMIHEALKARLDRLESQEALARSMAFAV